MAPRAIVVNPWHLLNEDGSIPDDTSLRNRAIRMAQCIEHGGPLARGQARETVTPCRLRPGGKQCLGLLWVLKQADDAIHAFCPVCGEDEFLIYEWEDTVWAGGQMEPVDVDTVARRAGKPPRKRGPKGADEVDMLLQRALSVLGCPMSAAEVRRLVATAPHPTAVLQPIVDRCVTPPTREALERFLPVLMETWNQTPRPELGGRSPDRVHAQTQPHRAPGRVARNAPCPCGSGKKHKRCCGKDDRLH